MEAQLVVHEMDEWEKGEDREARLVEGMQHVRLTGLGCEAFKDAAYNILEAQLMFERHFPEGAFEKWTADNTDGCVGNDISNRYLETRKAYPQEEVMFEKGVDPRVYSQRHAPEGTSFTPKTTNVDNEGERNEDSSNIRCHGTTHFQTGRLHRDPTVYYCSSHEELSHAAWTPSINELEKCNGGLGYDNGSTHNGSSDEDESTSEHGSLDAET
ncbi:hypothetical protein ARMSODRAFT_1005073 [Armillaria solidipes]|uniref:Uncharacterized protein n=1 Tax=Armillaria solidipes TaxID=1076256 RepID=A0A2H3BGN8_9AGAR|nr:hypothetical protein ARMSODRAFT_1005073 [Armillaria solidipes]